MLGYFDDQKATKDAFNKDGWFMTGDLGSLDANGYLRITGRVKDIIIRGGHNIHPARIEALAMRHPAVARARPWCPFADARLGEKVCLAVMFRTGRQAAPAELLAHLDAAGLSKYDMPEYFWSSRRNPAHTQRKNPQARHSRLDRARPRDVRSRCAGRQNKQPRKLYWRTMMRAVVVREFGPIENAKIAEMPKPAPKAGEVLLEIHATAVNFVDLIMMSGKYQFKPDVAVRSGKTSRRRRGGGRRRRDKFKVGDHAIAMVGAGRLR